MKNSYHIQPKTYKGKSQKIKAHAHTQTHNHAHMQNKQTKNTPQITLKLKHKM